MLQPQKSLGLRLVAQSPKLFVVEMKISMNTDFSYLGLSFVLDRLGWDQKIFRALVRDDQFYGAWLRVR